MNSSPNGTGDEFGTSMSFLGSSPFTKRFDQKVTSDSSVRDSNVVTASTADVNPNKQSSMVPHYEEQDSERDSVQAKSDTRLSKESDIQDVFPCESPRSQMKGPATLRVHLFSFHVI